MPAIAAAVGLAAVGAVAGTIAARRQNALVAQGQGIARAGSVRERASTRQAFEAERAATRRRASEAVGRITALAPALGATAGDLADVQRDIIADLSLDTNQLERNEASRLRRGESAFQARNTSLASQRTSQFAAAFGGAGSGLALGINLNSIAQDYGV